MGPKKRGRSKPSQRPAFAKVPAAAEPEGSKAKATEAGGSRLRTVVRQPPGRFLVIFLAVLVVAYALALWFLRPPSPGRSLRLDSVNRFAVCGAPRPPAPDASLVDYCSGVDERITEVRLLDEDARIIGQLQDSGGGTIPFWTSYPKSDAHTNDLLRNFYASGAEVTVDRQTYKAVVRFVGQFLLPLLILADVFALLFLLTQGGGGAPLPFLRFGRAGDRAARREDRSQVTFADVAGADDVVTELAEVRDYLADPTRFVAMGALPPKGVLLFGPPGCGKTLLARAVAGEVKGTFLSMSGSEFVEALVGVGAARVRDLFAQARASAPAVVFIDELDAVGRQRGAGLGQGNDEREQTLNELLTQIDGFSPTQSIVVIGATNRADILDPALLRSGRFDRQITVERPDLQGRLEILRLHARGRNLANPELDLAAMARDTAGFTGADLASVLNEAALLAVRERAATITRRHLDEAVERVVRGPRRRGQIMTEAERATVATHEAGHAVVAAAMGKGDGVHKLSVIARGRGIGHLAVLDGDRQVVKRGDMETQIAIAMGGYAAEELVYGEPSSGSEQDIDRATTLARDMAGRFGMSPRLGPVRLLAAPREVFLGRDYLQARDVSQPTLEHLDAAVRHILEEQHEAAKTILSSERTVLNALIADLMEAETLEEGGLAEHLSKVRSYESRVSPTGRPAGGSHPRARAVRS